MKLAWAFINIMNAIHHFGILHDLSKDNIISHYLVDKPNVVCDWGEARCLQEMMSSLYGFANEQDAINAKKKRVGGLPHNCFLFIASRELQIPLDEWPNNTTQL